MRNRMLDALAATTAATARLERASRVETRESASRGELPVFAHVNHSETAITCGCFPRMSRLCNARRRRNVSIRLASAVCYRTGQVHLLPTEAKIRERFEARDTLTCRRERPDVSHYPERRAGRNRVTFGPSRRGGMMKMNDHEQRSFVETWRGAESKRRSMRSSVNPFCPPISVNLFHLALVRKA